MTYFLHLFLLLCIYGIVATSLNIVVGFGGMLTLAHAGYFAVGCYTYALATLILGWGFVPAVVLGVIAGALFSLAVSLPAARLRGDFFVLITIAVQSVIYNIAYNWANQDAPLGTWHNLTNGPYGIAGIPHPVLAGFSFSELRSMTALYAGISLLCLWLASRLLSSPWGRMLKAIREDELAARALGKSALLARIQAFAIASGMVALAGSLYSAYVSYVDPEVGNLDNSILMLSMVLVAGVGRTWSPMIGTLLLIAIPELLRFLAIPDPLAANVRLMLYGVFLIVLMHFRPQGVAGEYRIQ